MNYLDFEIDSTKRTLDFSKKILLHSYGLIILNLTLCLWYYSNIYFHTYYIEWLIGILAGSTGISIVWQWLICWDARLDIKFYRDKLKLLENLKDNETMDRIKQ